MSLMTVARWFQNWPICHSQVSFWHKFLKTVQTFKNESEVLSLRGKNNSCWISLSVALTHFQKTVSTKYLHFIAISQFCPWNSCWLQQDHRYILRCMEKCLSFKPQGKGSLLPWYAEVEDTWVFKEMFKKDIYCLQTGYYFLVGRTILVYGNLL